MNRDRSSLRLEPASRRRSPTCRAAQPLLVVLVCALAAASCGKKGPPLPPLVRVPAAPADLSAARRGSSVDMTLVVPATNTDGSKPADLVRVDVFALTSADPVGADEIVRRGDKVASIAVNPPPDPDEDPDAPKPAPREPATGLEQGATAHVSESIQSPSAGELRSYVAVGVNKRGRRGPGSNRAAVPLDPPPDPPAAPQVSYSETAITISWDVAPQSGTPAAPVTVYDPQGGTRLTEQPISDGSFVDGRIEWGAERCYVLRRVEAVGSLTLESDPSPQTCVTLADTFPPAAPTGVTAVASEGAINLIWNASTERDLAGYLVLRSTTPEGPLAPVTPEPIRETTYRDQVPAGVRATYAIQAVDTAGNVGPASERIEETAR